MNLANLDSHSLGRLAQRVAWDDIAVGLQRGWYMVGETEDFVRPRVLPPFAPAADRYVHEVINGTDDQWAHQDYQCEDTQQPGHYLSLVFPWSCHLLEYMQWMKLVTFLYNHPTWTYRLWLNAAPATVKQLDQGQFGVLTLRSNARAFLLATVRRDVAWLVSYQHVD